MHVEKMRRAAAKFARVRLKKIHLDYLAGILSIPVLVTAIIINWSNLTHKTTPVTQNVSPSPQVIIVPQGASVVPTSSPTCQKSVGPIAISSPTEGESVSDNPVCITIDYSDPNYCSVVWSYRINGGAWSDFNNTSPCLYNLPNGEVAFNLRVNSTVSSDQQTLSRSFTYTGSAVATPTPSPTFTPTPVASSSAH